MSRAKKTRKFASMKRLISKRDDRLKQNQVKLAEKQRKPKEDELVRAVPQVSSSLFFQCTFTHPLPTFPLSFPY
jgi:U3 small nucleolar RNA-associated protein 24